MTPNPKAPTRKQTTTSKAGDKERMSANAKSAMAKASTTAPGAKPGGPTQLTIGKTHATVSRDAAGRGTLHLVRTIHAPARRIYDCFLDPDAYAKWLPPHGFSGNVQKMDARVGGKFHMTFSTIDRKMTHGFGGTYRELVPGKRIVLTESFDDPAFGDGEMTVTIDLKPVKGGTEVRIVQANIPPGPAQDGAPYGWSQSLDNLAALCQVDF